MTNNIVLLLGRHMSTMVSTWDEFLGIEALGPSHWRVGTFRYRWISLGDVPRDPLADEDDEIPIPDQYNGKKVRGLVDGEFLEIDELRTADDCEFDSDNLAVAMEFCQSAGWTSHHKFSLAWGRIVNKISGKTESQT